MCSVVTDDDGVCEEDECLTDILDSEEQQTLTIFSNGGSFSEVFNRRKEEDKK